MRPWAGRGGLRRSKCRRKRSAGSSGSYGFCLVGFNQNPKRGPKGPRSHDRLLTPEEKRSFKASPPPPKTELLKHLYIIISHHPRRIFWSLSAELGWLDGI